MIKLKSERDLEFLKVSGQILASTLAVLKSAAKEDVTLKFLDNLARNLLKEADATPAFLDYKSEGASKPYQAAICTSLNEQIVHGLPTEYKLKNGDVLKIDLGVNYKGYFTDAAVTIGIGQISEEARKLIAVTEKALYKAIEECRLGKHLGDIGWIIEKIAREDDFSVVRGLTGHGTGFELHEDPTVYNFGKRGEGCELKEGLVLAIEPMTSVGSGETKQQNDESFVTKDGSLSAHFEHTVAVTRKGPLILTKL